MNFAHKWERGTVCIPVVADGTVGKMWLIPFSGLDPLGDLMAPAPSQSTGDNQTRRQQGGKVLTGNLDESLASLAMNLTIDNKGQTGR